jgi:hypothetical protein
MTPPLAVRAGQSSAAAYRKENPQSMIMMAGNHFDSERINSSFMLTLPVF